MALTRYEKQVQALIDQMFVDISHTPGGYTYLYNLPKKGRSSRASLRRRWRRACTQVMLPDALHNAMVKACLTEEGKVDRRGEGLVQWLLAMVHLTPLRLFEEWRKQNHPN